MVCDDFYRKTEMQSCFSSCLKMPTSYLSTCLSVQGLGLPPSARGAQTCTQALGVCGQGDREPLPWMRPGTAPSLVTGTSRAQAPGLIAVRLAGTGGQDSSPGWGGLLPRAFLSAGTRRHVLAHCPPWGGHHQGR